MAEPGYLKDYIEVHDRITAFYARYPGGSLRCKDWSVVEANGQTFFVYVAQALRAPDDEAPAEGIAWEPIPGLTPYTKNSEAMVAETSAWGRAIAALGFEVKRGIASRQEVQNRRGADVGSGQAAHGASDNHPPVAEDAADLSAGPCPECGLPQPGPHRGTCSKSLMSTGQSPPPSPEEASPSQKATLTKLFHAAGLSRDAMKAVVLFRCGTEKATKQGAQQLITDLQEGATHDALLAEIYDAKRAGNPLGTRAAALIPSETPWDGEGLPPAKDITT